MSFSDEPNVISTRQVPKWWWMAGGIVGLLILVLAMVAFYPQYLEFKRKNTPVGPNMGPVYFINIEGERFSMEFGRSPEMDYHMGVFLRPVRDRVVWEPENYRVRFWIEGHEEVVTILDWNPEVGAFGPTEQQYHPAADYPLRVEIRRGDERVWQGNRWAYRLRMGHEH